MSRLTRSRVGGYAHGALLGVCSLGLVAGMSALPVVGGGRAEATPVRPVVEQAQVTDLPETEAAPAPSAPGQAPHRVVTASGEASLVGVTWSQKSAPPAGTPLEVRGRRTDRSWTDWTAVEVTAAEDTVARAAGKTTRAGTEPVWLGTVERVQVRYAEDMARAVRKGRLELIDPGASSADVQGSGPAASADAVTSRPGVISRKRWGADESLRRCGPAYGTTQLAMVLHHTAGSNSYTSAQSAGIVRGIYAYHTQSRGWCDIGYNALVDKYGQVFEGRYGGVNPVIGAHASGFNTDTYGVSVLGTFTSGAPSSAAMTAVAKLFAWRGASYYRSATSTSVLTSRSSASRYPAGTKVTKPFVIGHRDLGYTECPGNAAYAQLGSLRSSVASRTSYTSSPIYKRWRADGGASSRWGPVLRGEASVGFGPRTVFQRGWAMYAVGSSTRVLGPGIDRLYWRSGGPASWRDPLADERAITGGARADFRSGHVAVWSPATGAQPLFGGIKRYWFATGSGASPLGFPKAPERLLASGGVSQPYRSGTAYWKAGRGTHAVLSAMGKAYARAGGPGGRLGYPVSDQRTSSTGTVQAFEGGSIRLPAGRGAPVVTIS